MRMLFPVTIQQSTHPHANHEMKTRGLVPANRPLVAPNIGLGQDLPPTAVPAEETTPTAELHNIAEIKELDKRHRSALGLSDHVADLITSFSGSMLYVGIHVVWFGGWIVLNLGLVKAFDPFPFSLLTMIVSLEAIFLASFVLISQNKQAIQSDKRAKIDLQVNLIAERENTKLLKMLSAVQKHLGIVDEDDEEVAALKVTTEVSKLADAVDEAST
jgi:uncharacterized membrane protein